MQQSLFTESDPVRDEAPDPAPVSAPEMAVSVLKPMAGRTPRPYQAQAVIKAFEQFDKGAKGTLLRSPTGTGKSFMCALAIREWLSRGENRRVLVGLHDITLINQMQRELKGFLKIPVGIEQAARHINMDSDYHPRVIVGSRASLGVKEIENEDGTKETVSRLHKFDPFKYEWLVIPDECHRWRFGLPSCRPIIEHFDQNPLNKRLGLSATPERSDKAKFSKLFPEVCLDYTYGRAVDDGWIVDYRNKWIDLRHVKISNPELLRDQKDLDKAFDEILTDIRYLRPIVKPVIEQSEGRRTLVFCPDVRSCYAVAAEINKQLDRTAPGTEAARATHGGVKKDVRELIYTQHKRGDFQFLVVCGLCREGYDDPSLGAVAILRYVRSRGLAEQMKGRVARVLPGTVDGLKTPEERKAAIAASAKPDGLIIDLAGVTGLGEVPDTIDILAEGMPDDVIARAKKKIKEAQEKGEGVSPSEILRESEKEHKNYLEEVERRAAEIRARVQTEVDYDVRLVKTGEGGASNKQGHKRGTASPKQVDFLVKLGIKRETAETYSKQQAGAVITSRLKLQGSDYRITFGPHKGKSLGELPEKYIRMMEGNHEMFDKFKDVMPHIEKMWAERDASWDREFSGEFGEPSMAAGREVPAATHNKRGAESGKNTPLMTAPATPAHVRLAERFGLPIPKTYAEGVEIVNKVNSQKS